MRTKLVCHNCEFDFVATIDDKIANQYDVSQPEKTPYEARCQMCKLTQTYTVREVLGNGITKLK